LIFEVNGLSKMSSQRQVTIILPFVLDWVYRVHFMNNSG
jgi:hypothetical protein